MKGLYLNFLKLKELKLNKLKLKELKLKELKLVSMKLVSMKLVSILALLISYPLGAFPPKPSGKTYIFVSHSLNDQALKAYFEEALRYGATLVVRGLIEDSFMKTMKRVQELKISYDIAPQLYEEYEIKVVPTIVHITPSGEVKKISGHLPLADALQIFKGEV